MIALTGKRFLLFGETTQEFWILTCQDSKCGVESEQIPIVGRPGRGNDRSTELQAFFCFFKVPLRAS